MTHFTADDLYLHRKVTQLHACESPTGWGCAAATVRTALREGNRHASAVWEFHSDGAPARQLTQGTALDHSPRWAPDGATLAFISDRSDLAQLYLLDRQGGEARQLGDCALGAGAFRWTPGETPAQMVLYPGEDHHFLGEGLPACRADAASRIVDWLGLHVRPAS